MWSRGWPARPEPDEEGHPTGIVVGVGAASLVGAACFAALVAHTPGPRLGPLVVVVGLVAAWSGNGRAAVTVAVLAWPVGNGFLVNRYGTLSWHPRVDTWFVLALLGAVSLGMTVAQRYREPAERAPLVALLSDQPFGPDRNQSPPTAAELEHRNRSVSPPRVGTVRRRLVRPSPARR